MTNKERRPITLPFIHLENMMQTLRTISRYTQTILMIHIKLLDTDTTLVLDMLIRILLVIQLIAQFEVVLPSMPK